MSGAVVAVGGGHGLAATLRALVGTADRTTAIVSTADDGGSTGRLRELWDVPGVGDLRRCLGALAPPGGSWDRLLTRRFDAGELKGHAMGNLLLLTLQEELGGLQAACDEVARIAGIDARRARVVPATERVVTLHGRAGTGDDLEGQVALAATTGIDEVWVEPRSAAASPHALAALADADQIVLGPGSLYTSILAAIVVGDVRSAIGASAAQVVLVANLRSDQPEAAGHDIAAHVRAVQRHGVSVDVVLAHPGALPVGDLGVALVEEPVVAVGGRVHDPELLGAGLRSLRG
jgi:uncharacterized cofD-like protein